MIKKEKRKETNSPVANSTISQIFFLIPIGNLKEGKKKKKKTREKDVSVLFYGVAYEIRRLN